MSLCPARKHFVWVGEKSQRLQIELLYIIIFFIIMAYLLLAFCLSVFIHGNEAEGKHLTWLIHFGVCFLFFFCAAWF